MHNLRAGGALLGSLLLIAAAGCGRPNGKARTAADSAAPSRLAVFYTCDTEGHLYPCDCEGGREGGLARRATFLRAQDAPARILVDAGNVAAGAREWERLQFEHLLKGYAWLGYDAVNLGRREAGLPAADLRRLGALHPFLLSANLVDAAGQPVTRPFVVVTPKGGPRVGILGIMAESAPAAELGEGVVLQPPAVAIARYLPEVARESDFVVLLAFADEAQLAALAGQFFEIGLIVGGDVPQAAIQPLLVNGSIVTFITDKGKTVGRLDLELPGGGPAAVVSSAITALTDAVADAPDALPILAAYQAALSNSQFQVRESFRDDAEGLSVIDARRPAAGERSAP